MSCSISFNNNSNKTFDVEILMKKYSSVSKMYDNLTRPWLRIIVINIRELTTDRARIRFLKGSREKVQLHVITFSQTFKI